MAEFTARGKTSVDWFYGFKLHLVINDQGKLLAIEITAGNVDDCDPVPELTCFLFGKFFGADKLYRHTVHCCVMWPNLIKYLAIMAAGAGHTNVLRDRQ
ncbi:Transposase DDE domain-containing protein [Nitrosomonas communis]|uniref:Transposase DDE domain-containing protein n=1 Tax=Nitrosomonas communis TaxID=44574 RepID=A0A1I4VRD5_9PROT|nr:Transposase DDE domain-containing protein [Nitrosomonas communis]